MMLVVVMMVVVGDDVGHSYDGGCEDHADGQPVDIVGMMLVAS